MGNVVYQVLPSFHKVAVLVNPKAGGGHRFRSDLIRLRTVLRDLSIDHTIHITRGPCDAIQIARELKEEAKCDLLIVGGGDGTVNEAINGWIGSRIPMGILPMGTSNILARVLGIRGSIEHCMIKILYGQPRPWRLGKAANRYFACMAGVGLDGDVVKVVSMDEKLKLGRLSFVKAFWKIARKRAFPRVAMKIYNHTPHEVQGTLILATCVDNYGGFIRSGPKHFFREHPLWFVVFQSGSLFHYMKYISTGIVGTHIRLRDVLVEPAQLGMAQGVHKPAGVQVDGEYIGDTPVRIVLTEEYLHFIFPEPHRTSEL